MLHCSSQFLGIGRYFANFETHATTARLYYKDLVPCDVTGNISPFSCDTSDETLGSGYNMDRFKGRYEYEY